MRLCLVSLTSGSGPRAARVFHSLLGCVLLVAWLSLGQQVQLLIGSRGLLPLAPFAEALRANHVPWFQFPSLLVLAPGDAALDAGIAIGVALALLCIAGIGARLALLASAPLYLAYTVACRDFTSFQWDNLLIECCLLAAFLSRKHAAPAAHGLMRLLLFKLYLESGVAKAQSHLGDWFDGSAMSFYYETSPLPTSLAWYAHHLPDGWHALESWGALGLEGLVAFLILGPRPCRIAALAAFTGFQLVNLATANYGFFVYLTLVLHVFLLDDRDIAALGRRLPRRLIAAGRWLADRRQFAWWNELRVRPGDRRPGDRRPGDRRPGRLRAALGGAGRMAFMLYAVCWMAASLITAAIHFSGSERVQRALLPVEQTYRSFRVSNAYHLFGHITRERIEPEIQTLEDGLWTSHPFHYKPGAPSQRPKFAAPHQPRVDFRLWFYGLSFRRGEPRYVSALRHKICHDPGAVQQLFPRPLPKAPEAVRVQFWRYHFTTPEEKRATGDWWTRQIMQTLRPHSCGSDS